MQFYLIALLGVHSRVFLRHWINPSRDRSCVIRQWPGDCTILWAGNPPYPTGEHRMKKILATIGQVYFFASILIAPVLAQNALQSQRAPAATHPSYDFGFGYSFVRMGIPGSGHVNLNGANLNGDYDFTTRLGLSLEASYARSARVLGIHHNAYVISGLIGPVFYLADNGDTRIFLHALGGLGVVDAAVPASSTSYNYGWVTRPSFALGGGVERLVSGPLAVRFGADYLRTSFLNPSNTIQPQNNLRVTAGILLFPFRRRVGR